MTERCHHGIESRDCPLCTYARGVVCGSQINVDILADSNASLEEQRQEIVRLRARARAAEFTLAEVTKERDAKQRGYVDLHEMMRDVKPVWGDVWTKADNLLKECDALRARCEALGKLLKEACDRLDPGPSKLTFDPARAMETRARRSFVENCRDALALSSLAETGGHINVRGVICPRCKSPAIETDNEGALIEHYMPGTWNPCTGLRGCPCDDGDGEGCPVHGIDADLPTSSSSDRSKAE